MFDICLFDLDETLVRTEDIKDIREAGKNNDTPAYRREVVTALGRRADRHIYSQAFLQEIRARFPNLQLGIFTRSPRSYAETVLTWAYPGFNWDILVAYEDVPRTKPYGDGIDQAMDHFGILDAQHLPRTMLVGDSDVDVRSAYHCGCVVTLDKGAWPNPRQSDHWRALEHVPDAIINAPDQILSVLANPTHFLPELERTLATNAARLGAPRFDKIGHFVPRSIGGDTTSYQIYVSGRSFANYESVQYRKGWHRLTESIEENKDSDIFPDEWVETVRAFIASQYYRFFGPSEIIVSAVPHRPGRKPRLENFLGQLAASVAQRPLHGINVSCAPGLFAYKQGVRSQHGEHLGRDERFTNVRDHLYIRQPDLIKPKTSFLVIDDVMTTGASLIYAYKYLKDAGALDVKCLAFAKNVGNLF
ncbi:HAD hydrolase-like protein [Burkholderia dolosa]|uniref:HAD hydrolase-like protein n=1 Tax=Burkholderia dolosa TaxID=152500 RepID=A0A892I0I8_9BURK|nr:MULTISPECIES: HAD hydrolase-like protein [Burkholderia]AKE02349.1 hypothetical protein XM57_04945 [Burkholderia cepacia]AJY13294.1 NLI interacting factor-like phosphatase family protein [Burkholderia dolosa AU0158]AYZ97096.1 hypothetical protein EGY28_18730 [Burkholderia dolosa]MBR8420624.1 HAD hydrolase-like protein [Burkholderia dolosa]MBY4657715.1 HAD hydrolase-like protein [Burkholderia dolosa]